VYLHREDFTYGTFAEFLDNLDLDENEVGEEIKLFVVVDQDCLKESDSYDDKRKIYGDRLENDI
jgi:hypothetical protein